jgi:hypothetical protein
MAAIYTKASDVVVWLGEVDRDTPLVYQLIDEFDEQIVDYRRKHLSWPHNPRNPRAGYIPLTVSDADRPQWLALRKFFSRPWFSRVWTFQELVLARQASMRCGNLSTSWRKLIMVCMTVNAWDRQYPDHLAHLKGTDNMIQFMGICAMAKELNIAGPNSMQRLEPYLDLGNLMRALMGCGTTKPHDKIYGLLGVAMNVDAKTFPINYETPFREAFAFATKLVIQTHRDLSILCLKRITPGKKPQIGPNILPSRVPDYRFDDIETQIVRVAQGAKLLNHGSDRLYNATGSSIIGLGSCGGLTLSLQGIYIGSIADLSEIEENRSGHIAVSPNVLTGGQWHEIAERCSVHGVYKPTGEPIQPAYHRTRIWDVLPGEYYNTHRMARGSQPTFVPEPRTSAILRTANGERLLVVDAEDKMPQRIISGTSAQRLFTTTEGYMGICHLSCIEGDEAWLIMGSDVPYIRMFFVYGPQAPTAFATGPISAEVQGAWIVRCTKYLAQNSIRTIEATEEAEKKCREHVNTEGFKGLFAEGHSWWYGENIPGKPKEALNYMAGMPAYKRCCSESETQGYSGFVLSWNMKFPTRLRYPMYRSRVFIQPCP